MNSSTKEEDKEGPSLKEHSRGYEPVALRSPGDRTLSIGSNPPVPVELLGWQLEQRTV